MEEQETKDRLRRNTDEVIRRGVFGAPTFFVGGEMFWGNDRLDWVEEALRRAEKEGRR
jgi:2-hydroxychromene-2-carboxylate isomerase